MLADRAGSHRSYIGGIERAERTIHLVYLRKIAKALEVGLSKLLTD